MDDNQFRLIEKLFEASEARSDERHKSLVIRLDERFEHWEKLRETDKLSTDGRLAGHEGRMNKIENDLSELSGKVAGLEKTDAKQSGIMIVLGAIGGAVLATVSAIVASLFGR